MYGIELCRIESKQDMDFLYSAFTGEDQFLYSTTLRFNTKQWFEKWIWERIDTNFHDFFLIKDVARNDSIGFVHDYDFSLIDGHCKLSLYIDGDHRQTGIGGVAAIRFMDYLFSKYPLRKVYSTIYDYNSESLSSNLAAGFTEEGIIEDFRYHDGKHYALHILSMSRESFDNILRKLVR